MGILARYAALSTFIIAVFFVIAAVTEDPHWLQRGGALLAAISATLAIIEAFFERKIEVRSVEAGLEEAESRRQSPLRALERKIRGARFRQGAERLSSDKARIVFTVSAIAIFGEVLHGFGDFIFEYVWGALESVFVWAGSIVRNGLTS